MVVCCVHLRGLEKTAKIQQRRNELQTIVEKIGEIESDADEHRYVLKTNASLVVKTLAEVYEREPERTCFRLVGGVLVERTVKDVLSTLQTTMDGVRTTHNLTPAHQGTA